MMIRLTKELKLDVDTLKFKKLSSYFCSAAVFYLLLLAFGNLGPKKEIPEPLSLKYCDPQLHFDNTSSLPPGNQYSCLACKNFGPLDRIYEISLKAEVEYSEQYGKKNEDKIDFSITEIRYNERQENCLDILAATNQSAFPYVNESLLTSIARGPYNILDNNFKQESPQDCEVVNGITKCEVPLIEDQAFASYSLGFKFLIKFDLEEQKNLTKYIERANFVLEYQNPKFTQFILFFRIFFIVTTIGFLIFSINRLSKFDRERLASLHSWILIILLSQIFFNDPCSVAFEFFKFRIFLYLSEFFKIFHLTLLLYFWMSVFDQILIEKVRISWKNLAVRSKQLLLGSIFVSVLVFRAKILYGEIEGKYFMGMGDQQFNKILHTIIFVLSAIFTVYFLVLAGVYFRLYCKNMLPSSRSSSILYGLTVFAFILTLGFILKENIKSNNESAFEYLGFTGAVNVYIFLVSLLYMPAVEAGTVEKEIEFQEQKEHEDIMKEVYGDVHDDDDEEDEDEEEHKENDTKLDTSDIQEKKTTATSSASKGKAKELQKKKAWESIQKSLETEDDKKHVHHDDDDEYLYI